MPYFCFPVLWVMVNLFQNENINSEPLILDDYFSEDVNKLNFSLIPIIEMHRATTEESDYWWLDTKETYRKK